MNKYNPFEIPAMKPDRPLKVLFLTDSLGNKIISRNPIFDKLHKLNEFDEIDIWFSPTQDTNLERILSDDIKSKRCEYSLIEAQYPSKHFIASLICGKRTTVIQFLYPANCEYPPNLFENINSSRINFMELELIHRFDDPHDLGLFDLVVAHQDDIDLLSLTGKYNIVCPEEVMERIRLFMLNYRLFFVEKRFKTCEFSYYAYRRLKMFPNITCLWSILDSLSNDSEWIQSLYTRTELYLRATDTLKINSLRKPTNSVATQCEYDFAFLILLITGIFDNLAWLVCKIYEITLNKNDIKLTIPSEKRNQKFIKAVQEKSQSLYDYLSNDLTQAKISLVYPIRDSVVHKNYLTTVQYVDIQKRIDDIYLKVSPEMHQKFERLTELGTNLTHCFKHDNINATSTTDIATGSKSVAGASEDMYIIPYEFIDMIDNIVRDLVDSILDIMVASKNVNTPHNDLSGFFEFLGTDVEPLYF